MIDKGRKKGVGYSLLLGITYLHAMLPFKVLYMLSDFLYGIVYHLVRYRRKLVRKNLKNAFPEKSEKEIVKIERKFYHHLCDYFVETIKTLRLSDEEVNKRMKFENIDMINQLTSSGQSCVVSIGHYANWEWIPSIVMFFTPGVEQGLIYKKLHSEAFDQLFLKIRSRFKSRPIEMRNAFRQMLRFQNEGKTMVVGFLSDQRPKPRQEHYWTDFLNQQTPVQTGMENIARKLESSVVFLGIEKTKRGYYTGKFQLISPNAGMEEKYFITEQYTRRLEESILKDPAYYLWTHNRWKFRKPNVF